MRILLSLFTLLFTLPSLATLKVYTDREKSVLLPIAQSFKKATGVDVEILDFPAFGTMKGTISSEGAKSPADVIFTKDLIYLTELARDGFFQPLPQKISNKVDASMRDTNSLWTAITYRARTLVYNASLDVSSINSYEDLASTDLAGTLCLRAGNSTYNQGLVASLIVSYGSDKAAQIVKGWLANRTEDKFYKDDTTIIDTIATGVLSANGSSPACLLGITNSYYLGKYLQKNPNAPVKIKFLSQNKNGTHTNGTGAGIAAHSTQKEIATQFIDFLLSKEMQLYLTNEHQDFPAATGIKPNNVSAQWLPFTFNQKSWSAIGDMVEDAKLLMIDTQFK